MNRIYIYLIAVNVIALVTTVYDKNAAKRGKWRVSEKNLLFYSLLGGAVVMYLTMLIINHKTKKKKFMVGIPLIIILQAISAVLLATLN